MTSVAEHSPRPLSRFEQFAAGRTEKKILPSMNPEYPLGFDSGYIEARREGYVPIIIANHQSHSDGLPIIPIVDHLLDLEAREGFEEQTSGFMMIIAESMNTGHQEGQVTSALEKMRPLLAAHDIEFLSYVREKDKDKYKLKRNQQKFVFGLVRGIKDNKGVVLFPETTVQGGRKKSGLFRRKIHGMRKFDWESEEGSAADLYDFDRAIEASGRKAVYICAALNGGYNVFSADNNKITKRAQIAAVNPIPTKLVSIQLAQPIRSDVMKQEIEESGREVNKSTIGDYLGMTVASMLPKEAQGEYADLL